MATPLLNVLNYNQVFENLTDVSSYSYDSAKQELVSYDTPHIVTIKAQYVQNNGLAGSMFWDVWNLSRACGGQM